MAVKLEVKINLEGKDSTQKAFRAVAASAEGLASKITAISTAYLAFGRNLASMFAAPIEKALEAESAANKLATSLQAAGRYTEESFQAMSKYADTLERASGLSSEQIQNLAGQNAMLGLNADQTKALAEASVYLAKATGVDLANANSQLILSLNGTVREMKKNVRGVGEMTEAQLRGGAAIRQVQSDMRQFVNADAGTTAGAWLRIKVALDNYLESVGLALLKGFSLSSSFTDIVAKLEQMTKAIEANDGSFVRLGASLAKIGGKGFDIFISTLKKLVPILNGLLWTLGKLDDVIHLISTPFEVLINYARKAAAAFQDMAEASRSIGGNLGNLVAIKRMFGVGQNAERESLEKQDMLIEKNAKEHWLSLLGITKEGAKKVAEETTNKFPGKDYGPNKSLMMPKTEAPKFQGTPFKDTKSDENDKKAALKAALEAQKSLNEEVIALEAQQGSAVVAEHYAAYQKIIDFQKIAAKGGVDVTAAAYRAQSLLAEQYSKKIAQESLKQKQTVAAAMGQTRVVIRLALQEQINDLQDYYEKGLIKFQDFLKRKAELQKAAAEKEMGTSGSDIKDEKLGKISQLVGSVQGGLNSIIQTIGSYFGPYGTIIAGVITLLNQTKETFNKMMTDLMDSMDQLPENIATNIGVFLERIPEILSRMFQQMFNLNFWSGLINSLFTGLKNMFTNFFAVIFGGKLVSQISDAGKKAEFKGFGSDDPNAGDGKFKIKDADLSKRRKAGNFEDTFKDTVQEAQKGLVQYMAEAIQRMLKDIGAFFLKAIDDMANMIGMWGEKFGAWGKKVWDGFTSAIGQGWHWLLDMGSKIWEGVRGAYDKAASWLMEAGGKIWNGLTDAVKKAGGFVSDLGKDIWHGFTEALKGGGSKIAGIGGDAFGGFIERIKEFPKTIAKVGADMWDGFKERIKDFPNTIANVGKNMWSGFADAMYKAWDWVKNFFASAMPLGNTGTGGGGYAPWENWNRGGVAGSQGGSNPGLARAMISAGALTFAGGGKVPGSGFRDSVPAVLTPGEVVLNRNQVQAMGQGQGGQVINFTFNVAAGAKMDKDAVREAMPQIIEMLRRESRNGTIVVRANGVA